MRSARERAKEAIALRRHGRPIYLVKPCDGCGGKIEVTQPQVHVFSRHTGLTYCGVCNIGSLPPINKRPAATRELTVKSGSFREPERRPKVATEATPQDTAVLDGLLALVAKEIPNVEQIQKSGYVTLKVGGKTIGYVNGKSKLRIDGIVKEGNRQKFMVTNEKEIAGGVAFLKEGAARVAEKQAAAGLKASAAAEKSAAKAKAGSAATAKKEAKPDPKPATSKNARRRQTAKKGS